MVKFRIVLLQPAGVEVRYRETLDFKEIEEALQRDTVVGVFVGKG